ncbi:MAG TPA: hypothetical protein VKR58_04095 [Aquella sp.]|nr:hypothetical protein [Aquella sp.]
MKIKLNKKLFGLSVALSFYMSITYAEHVYCGFQLAQKDNAFTEALGKDGIKVCSNGLCSIQWSYKAKDLPPFSINIGFINGVFTPNQNDPGSISRITGLSADLSPGKPKNQFVWYNFQRESGGSVKKPYWALSFARLNKPDKMGCEANYIVECSSDDRDDKEVAEFTANLPALVKEREEKCPVQ